MIFCARVQRDTMQPPISWVSGCGNYLPGLGTALGPALSPRARLMLLICNSNYELQLWNQLFCLCYYFF